MARTPVFWLLTVADCKMLANGELDACLKSVAIQKVKADIRHQVLLARPTKQQVAALKKAHPATVFVVEDRLRPLSRNRNILLRPLLDAGLVQAEDFVAFPDDDLRYPEGYLRGVTGMMREQKLDCLLTSFGDEHVAVHPMFPTTNTGVWTHGMPMAAIASPTMFFTGAFVLKVGLFDERLGLGTPAACAEDTDYVLRGLYQGLRGAYQPELVLYHPMKAGNIYKYYMGAILTVVKYPPTDLTATHAFLKVARRMVYGSVYLLQGKIGWKNYWGVMKLVPVFALERLRKVY